MSEKSLQQHLVSRRHQGRGSEMEEEEEKTHDQPPLENKTRLSNPYTSACHTTESPLEVEPSEILEDNRPADHTLPKDNQPPEVDPSSRSNSSRSPIYNTHSRRPKPHQPQNSVSSPPTTARKDEQIFKCSLCSTTAKHFKTTRALDQHINSSRHEQRIPKPAPVDPLTRTYSSPPGSSRVQSARPQAHVEGKHENAAVVEKGFRCLKCPPGGKKFKSRKSLEQHLAASTHCRARTNTRKAAIPINRAKSRTHVEPITLMPPPPSSGSQLSTPKPPPYVTPTPEEGREFYSCPKCPPARKKFNSLRSMEQHLAMARHSDVRILVALSASSTIRGTAATSVISASIVSPPLPNTIVVGTSPTSPPSISSPTRLPSPSTPILYPSLAAPPAPSLPHFTPPSPHCPTSPTPPPPPPPPSVISLSHIGPYYPPPNTSIADDRLTLMDHHVPPPAPDQSWIYTCPLCSFGMARFPTLAAAQSHIAGHRETYRPPNTNNSPASQGARRPSRSGGWGYQAGGERNRWRE